MSYRYRKGFKNYAHTSVFWNVDDFLLPADFDGDLLIRRIGSAIRRYDSLHYVRIHAYGETPVTELSWSYSGRNLTYCPIKEDKLARQTRMLLEIIQLLYINKKQNLFKKLCFMIISKGFPQVLVPYLEELKLFYGVEIYIVVPDGCVLEDEALFNTASLVWEWDTLLAGGFAKMALPYDPNFTMIEDQEHDAFASAAIVAVDLISKARLRHNLDSVYTAYSAQYLVDFARPRKKKNKKGGRKKGGKNPKLTVKDCLKFALEKGVPKAEDWPHPHLGSLASSYKPFLVCMEGIELVDCVPATKLGGGTELGGIDYRIGRGVAKVETGSGGVVSVYKLQGTLMLQIDGVSPGVILHHLKEIRIDGVFETGSGGGVYMCKLPGGKQLRIDGDLAESGGGVSEDKESRNDRVETGSGVFKLGGGIELGGIEFQYDIQSIYVETGSGGGVSVYKVSGNIRLVTNVDLAKVETKPRLNKATLKGFQKLQIDGDLAEVETDSDGDVYLCNLPRGNQLRIVGDLTSVETDSGGGGRVTKLGGGSEFGGIEYRTTGGSVKVETGYGGGVSVYKVSGKIILQTNVDLAQVETKIRVNKASLNGFQELRIDGDLVKVQTDSGGHVYLCDLPRGNQLRIVGDLTSVETDSSGGARGRRLIGRAVNVETCSGVGVYMCKLAGRTELQIDGDLTKVETDSGGGDSVQRLPGGKDLRIVGDSAKVKTGN